MSQTNLTQGYEIALFKYVKDNKPKNVKMSWQEFFSRLEKSTIYPEKKLTPAFSPVKYPSFIDKKEYTFEKELKDKDGNPRFHVWITKDGARTKTNTRGEIVRANENVRAVTMGVFDFDSGKQSLNQLQSLFDKYEYIIYSTWNHTKENPKFRVIIPFSKPIHPERFKKVWPHVLNYFGGTADGSCKDPARLYFIPSCPKERIHERIFIRKSGDFLTYREMSEWVPDEKVDKDFSGKKVNSKIRRKKIYGDFNTLDAVKWFTDHSSYIGPGNNEYQHYVVCPWRHEHTDEKQGDTDTVLWVEPGKWPTFHCSHEHCRREERNIKQVINLWGDADDYCTSTYSSRKKREAKIKADILALGYDMDGNYWYQNTEDQHIVGLNGSKHHEIMFYTIVADRNYWFYNWGSEEDGKIDWKKAAADLISRCHKKGFFRPQNVRGAGIWNDDGKVVAHLGSKLLVDGLGCDLKDFVSDHTYEATVQKINHLDPLNDKGAMAYYKMIQNLPIPSKIERVFLAGSVVAGVMSGFLRWRPHVWLTGDAGSGKSAILKNVVSPIWSPIGGLYSEGETTAAGIRQQLRSNALPVIIDESESNSNSELNRVQSLLRLARSSSSDSDAKVLKGTIGGEGMSFTVRSTFMMASIAHALELVQDRERFTLINCRMSKHSREYWPTLRNWINKTLTPSFSYKFFARAIIKAPQTSNNIEKLHKMLLRNIHWATPRWADQVSTLFCCALSLVYSENLTDRQLWSFFVDIGKPDDTWYESLRPSKEEEDTGSVALNHLINHIIMTGDNKRTSVGELIAKSIEESENPTNLGRGVYLDEINRYGISISEKDILISTHHPQTRKIFREWGFSGHGGLLSLIEGSKIIKDVRFGYTRSSAIAIPLTLFTLD